MYALPEHKLISSQLSVIFDTFTKSETHIRPHFMLTGHTGTGKSHLIQFLAQERDLNFIEINAAQLTAEGISGNSLSKALSPLKNLQNAPVVVFVDEFDKIFVNSSDSTNAPSVSVQDEFLKVLEADSTSVFGDYGKYIEVNTSNVLYVFAGSFSNTPNIKSTEDLKKLGVRSEFLGRVNLHYQLPSITQESYLKVLENHKLLNQYLNLYPQFKKAKVVKALTQDLLEQYPSNTIGLRLISSLINRYFINSLTAAI